MLLEPSTSAIDSGSVIKLGFFILAFGMLFIITYRLVMRDAKLWRSSRLYKSQKTIPDVILNVSGFDFERWVQGMFLQNNIRATVTQQRGDHGIDLTFSYRGKRYMVQCKKYYQGKFGKKYFSGTIGEPVLRDVYGAMYHGRFDKALVITTGAFTKQARAWAYGKRDFAIIDGAELTQLIQYPEKLKKYL